MALTVLGLSGAVNHDPSAALYIDGKLVAAVEEERFVHKDRSAGVTYSSGDGEQERPSTMRRDTPKVGRNDECPCGSGKKYKKCCGKGK